MRAAVLSAIALAWSAAGLAFAQTPVPATVRIPAGSEIQMEFVQELSSTASRQGQLFELRLAEPIIVDGQVIVRAGAIGGGEVIDAQPGGTHGVPGVLVVSGRFVEVNGARVRIRGMQILGGGVDQGMNAAVGFLTYGTQERRRGGEIRIVAGTRASANIAIDLDVPITAQETPGAGPQ